MLVVASIALALAQDTGVPSESTVTPAAAGWSARYETGYYDGRAAAYARRGRADWYLLGAGSVIVVPPIGFLTIVTVGAVAKPPIPLGLVPLDSPQDYERGFVHGYQKRMRGQHAVHAFVGGVVTAGVVVTVGVIYLAVELSASDPIGTAVI